jgi:hypothetical protein
VTETKVKRLLCCRFRRTCKAMEQVYQCWWRIFPEINVFLSIFECHMFSVLYPLATYLLTLPRTIRMDQSYFFMWGRPRSIWLLLHVLFLTLLLSWLVPVLMACKRPLILPNYPAVECFETRSSIPRFITPSVLRWDEFQVSSWEGEGAIWAPMCSDD